MSDVSRIAALSDPVLRNPQITQCYHRLGLALGACTGWEVLAAGAGLQPPGPAGDGTGRVNPPGFADVTERPAGAPDDR